MQKKPLRAYLKLLLAVAPALSGCLSHTRTVPRTHLAPLVLDASLNQLVQQMDTRFKAIQTMNADIEISGISGGSLQGEVKESISLAGYLFIRKPEDLRIYLKVPVVSSLALDMVSDGSTFKLYIPSRHKAVVGTGKVTTPSANPLENLRPSVFFNSLLLPGIGSDELISMTLDSHIVDHTAQKKGDLVELPEYQLSILATPKGKEVHTLRVIHISRADLLPYKQEIYDDQGRIVTRAEFSNYQKVNDVPYPMTIVIERPLDHYGLHLTITKLILNQKLDDEQFELKIPEGVPIQQMP